MKEQKWAFTYKKANGEVKTCYPKSKEMVDKNRQTCKEKGLEIISVKKLYPFGSMKHQHNFDLINSLCYNEMHDMDYGEIPYDRERYEWLEKRKEDAERFFSLPMPVAWLPWEDWKRANELAQDAINHRQDACIANGRPDLVTYC